MLPFDLCSSAHLTTDVSQVDGLVVPAEDRRLDALEYPILRLVREVGSPFGASDGFLSADSEVAESVNIPRMPSITLRDIFAM